MTERQYHIAVIPGDGTGPEMIAAGLKVLEAVSSKNGFRLACRHFSLGAAHYNKTGETLSKIVEKVQSKLKQQ